MTEKTKKKEEKTMVMIDFGGPLPPMPPQTSVRITGKPISEVARRLIENLGATWITIGYWSGAGEKKCPNILLNSRKGLIKLEVNTSDYKKIKRALHPKKEEEIIGGKKVNDRKNI